jgi:hypothetical protein
MNPKVGFAWHCPGHDINVLSSMRRKDFIKQMMMMMMMMMMMDGLQVLEELLSSTTLKWLGWACPEASFFFFFFLPQAPQGGLVLSTVSYGTGMTTLKHSSIQAKSSRAPTIIGAFG